MTHRQYLAWEDWLEREQDTPSRADHYQMQTTGAIVAAHGLKLKKGLVLKLSKQDNDGKQPKTSWTVEESTAMWKARNAQRYGVPISGKRS